MKNIYLVMALLVALPLCLISKLDSKGIVATHSNNSLMKMTNNGKVVLDKPSKDKEFLPISLGSLGVLDTTVDIFWNSLLPETMPIAYEPISNTILVLQSNRFNYTKNGAQVFRGELYLYYSNDNGANWTKTTAFAADEEIPVFPTLTVINPKKSSNPKDLLITIAVRKFKGDGTGNYNYEGHAFLFSNTTGLSTSDFEPFVEKGPANDNPSNYNWGIVNGFAYNTPESAIALFYSQLSPASDNYQYGIYGVGNIEFSNEDGTVLSNYSVMPQNNWGVSNWRQPAGKPQNTYNAPLNVDADANGTLYAAVNNVWADRELQERELSISKSTDNGQTWSDFDRTASAVINAYIAQEGLVYAFDPAPYSAGGFAVTGVDQYSFVMTFKKIKSVTPSIEENVFAELSKKDGEWKIRTIAQCYGLNTFGMQPYLLSDTNSTTDVWDEFDRNPRSFEIQLAKTADGQNILVKYLDINEKIAVLNNKLNLLGSNSLLDSMLSTDIWVAYRNVASDGEWSAPKNITSDDWFNRSTWIPRIIPSLTQVPILEFTTKEWTNPESARVKAGYPYFLQNYFYANFVTNNVLFSSFDAVAGENIRNPVIQKPTGVNGVTSVEDQMNIQINSLNIYPNPANGSTSITYDIANNANVKIEIFNTMGQLVKTVRNYSLATPGITSLSFDASELSNGVYYVTMTANGNKITKVMNVVR
ncbi:MAG TPA: T9SS type A sorting domain-containing protein [Candidatus Kapabacteria bacterium]|nr:T9SS type A sorting domain-containing protein [Candidatus Kapabacteria bacterium]